MVYAFNFDSKGKPVNLTGNILENLDDLSPIEIEKIKAGIKAYNTHYDILKLTSDFTVNAIHDAIFKPLVDNLPKYEAMISDILAKELPTKRTIFQNLVSKYDPKIGYYRAAQKAELVVKTLAEAIKAKLIKQKDSKIDLILRKILQSMPY